MTAVRSGNRTVFWFVGLSGFCATALQVLLMRELVVIFYGNELSLGTMLGVWLLWTALGSGVLGRRFSDHQDPQKRFWKVQTCLAVAVPLLLVGIRAGKRFLGITLGETIGFVPMLAFTGAALFVPCVLFGFLYATACQWVVTSSSSDARRLGQIYLAEALGSAVGGAVTSLVVAVSVSPPHAILFVSGCLLLSSILFSADRPIPKFRLKKTAAVGVSCIFLILLWLSARPYKTLCDRILWKGYSLVAVQDTRYGNIAATRFGEQFSFFENGLLVSTFPDPQSAEESVHFTLLQHRRPRRVLLIGGGLAGGIRETLKHPSVETVDHVDLDPSFSALFRETLPEDTLKWMSDPRVEFHHADARQFVKKARQTWDVVIVNLPNPFTAQLNRFYTLDFFREISRILNPEGVFSIQVQSSENVIGPDLSRFLRSLNRTLSIVFPYRKAIPGETVRLIGSRDPGILSTNSDSLILRLRERGISTRFIREYYLPFQMSADRLALLEDRIRPDLRDRINRDFAPIGYYYDTILWATALSRGFKTVFVAFSRVPLSVLLAFPAVAAVLTIAIFRLLRKRKSLVISGTIASLVFVGFTEISLEVVLILGFQILFGYVYQDLALIVAGYMVGLSFGGWVGTRNGSDLRNPEGRFLACQLAIALLPLFMAGFFGLIHRIGTSPPGTGPFVGYAFPLLAAAAGAIGGLQFPLANRLFILHGRPPLRTGGFLYGIDLVGSSAGAFLTSAFFIPLFGLYWTLAFLSCLNISAFAVLLSGNKPGLPSPPSAG
jgi:spermidine synthase